MPEFFQVELATGRAFLAANYVALALLNPG